jgi:glycosyltransferase involved in cell wall biosynthesis
MIGGGTRVKILEALAMARPVVSTSLGAEGLDLVHGDSVLFADDAARFATHVLDVLRDSRVAAQLGATGRAHVVEHFDWNRIGDGARRLLGSRIGLTCRGEAGVPPSRVADLVGT